MNSTMHFIENNLWHAQCPACGSQSIRELGKQSLKKPELYSSFAIVQSHRPEIWACLSCKSMFKQNSVNEADSVMLYPRGNATSRWSGDAAKTKNTFLTKKTAAMQKFLKDILLKSKNVLDIGCNDGLFLDDARRFGLKTSGVEYSCEARSFCSAKEHIGHHEKYRFTLEVPIETHVQAGVSIGQWSWQGRFFVVPYSI